MKYPDDNNPYCTCGNPLSCLSTNHYKMYTTSYYDCKGCGLRWAIKHANDDNHEIGRRCLGVRHNKARNAHKRSTLCWDCKNAIGGGCSWFTDFTPVAGWKAKKERLYSGCSYTVEDCPQFEDGRARKAQ